MPLPSTLVARRPDTGSPSFSVGVDLVRGRLHLTGSLGRGTTHLFQDAVTTLLLTDRGAWVVDVSGLTTCDPAGVRAIATAYRRALRHERRMTLTGPSPALHRELTRFHLDHHLLDSPPADDRRSPVDRGVLSGVLAQPAEAGSPCAEPGRARQALAGSQSV